MRLSCGKRRHPKELITYLNGDKLAEVWTRLFLPQGRAPRMGGASPGAARRGGVSR